MKKLNSKGFLLVETLVVATFSLTVLVILYTQFRDLVVNYNNSYNYNTVEGIYNLNSMKKYVSQNESTSSPLSKKITTASPYIVIGTNNTCNIETQGVANTNVCAAIMTAGGFKQVIYTNSDITALKTYVNKTPDESYAPGTKISEGMRNFINQIELESNKNRLIAEYKNGTFATITYGKIS